MYEYEFEFSSGDLSLDFCNTVSGKRGGEVIDHLTTYVRLIDWGEQGGLVSREDAGKLRSLVDRRPESAMRIHQRAVALREAIFRLVQAASAQTAPDASDLGLLNAELESADHSREVAWQETGYAWREKIAEPKPDCMLGWVAAAAADLLTSDKTSRVRECGSETCGWLFLDLTRNHSRRWCDMKVCGNRAKVRQHRARKAVAG